MTLDLNLPMNTTATVMNASSLPILRSSSSGPSSNSQGGDGTELATVLLLGASLSPSVSV